jgi:predicted flap endonuclease-1-like 5' DNA nuclease
MTFLLVQTFLLLLGAFLLGASLACLVRRAFSGRSVDAATVPASSPGLTGVAAPAAIAEAPLATDRFGRALAGQGPNVPPVFQGPNTGPVVEVQPPPPRPVAVQPPPAVDASPAAPAPAAEPAPPPVAAPAPAEDVPADNAFKPVVGRTYTEIAVAAAAAAAAKAKAEAEEAERAAQAEAASAPPVAESPAVQGADAGATDESRFGTLVPPAALGASALASREPIDDLTRIRSIDADLKERLHRYGIHTFAAIAAWTPDDVRGVSQTLGFQGRIEQENWIEQARILATGGDANFSRSQAEPVDIAVPVDGERLHRVIGIDPKSEQLLFANGVTRLSQIAAWSDADGANYEALLGIAAGRILREGWVEQAKFLTRAERGEPDPEPPAEAPPPAGGDGTSHLGLPPKDEPAAAPSEQPARIANKTEIITIASRPSAGEAASSRDSLTGLRSVKSEALRGAPAGVNTGEVNDLKRIRGIGVLIEKKLNSLGITGYEQVANWTGADIDRISQLLDFKGRIERENWIEQARILASGGQTEFSRRVDRGEA